MAKVPVQPLFTQHSDERSQERHQQTCVEEVRGCDYLRGGTIPRWGSGRVFVWNDGSIETEEDCAEVGFRPFTGIWLKL